MGASGSLVVYSMFVAALVVWQLVYLHFVMWLYHVDFGPGNLMYMLGGGCLNLDVLLLP